jgi:hypothetical protein
MLREWAYARVYATSAERLAALPLWLDRYNWRNRTAASATDHPVQG